MEKIIKVILIHFIILTAIIISGCTTYYASSEPPGAIFYYNETLQGKLPGSFTTARPYRLDFALDGYSPDFNVNPPGKGGFIWASHPPGAVLIYNDREIAKMPVRYQPTENPKSIQVKWPEKLTAGLKKYSTAIYQDSIQYGRTKTLKITSPENDKTFWALVIGISRYQFSGQNDLTNLIFADDDAKVFTRTLQSLGWEEDHIKLLMNEKATQRNVMIALESWLSKAGPKDLVVLFWAGHGYSDPENPEKVYLATYDTDISIPATGYRMDRVRSALEEIGSKNVILLADTCHAGKLITRGERGISIVPQIDKMKREQKIPKGWIFMVGADTDRQAIEHTSWKNGAFTHSLIRGLSGKADGYQSIGPKDGTVTMGELRAYMNTAMPEETHKVLGVAKRPVITTSTGDPDIWNLTLQVK